MVAPSREARELSARYRRRPRRAATFAIRPSPCGLGAQARAAQPQVADGWRVAEAGAGRARSAQGNRAEQIGSANVRTPVTNTQLVCRFLLEKKKKPTKTTQH